MRQCKTGITWAFCQTVQEPGQKILALLASEKWRMGQVGRFHTSHKNKISNCSHSSPAYKRREETMLRKILIAVLACVMYVSGFLMIRRDLVLTGEEGKFARLQEKMAKQVSENAEYAAQRTVPPEKQGERDDTNIQGQETGDSPAYEVPQALSGMMASYPDCIGWIDIEDTNVHYPVMQNAYNEYYLHRDVNGEESISGCIYMDANHDINGKGLHTIYGHHMKNGSMFKDVARFADPVYMEEHQQVAILTMDREIRLKPAYCYTGKADGTYRRALRTHGQVIRFIMEHTGLEINTDDLYVLVTCSYGSADERTYLYCIPDVE